MTDFTPSQTSHPAQPSRRLLYSGVLVGLLFFLMTATLFGVGWIEIQKFKQTQGQITEHQSQIERTLSETEGRLEHIQTQSTQLSAALAEMIQTLETYAASEPWIDQMESTLLSFHSQQPTAALSACQTFLKTLAQLPAHHILHTSDVPSALDQDCEVLQTVAKLDSENQLARIALEIHTLPLLSVPSPVTSTPQADPSFPHSEGSRKFWTRWEEIKTMLWAQGSRLIQIRRMDDTTPSHFFVAENRDRMYQTLKLQVLSARLSLMTHRETFKEELQQIRHTMTQYLDPKFPKTQNMLNTLEHIEQALPQIMMPRFNQSLAALAVLKKRIKRS